MGQKQNPFSNPDSLYSRIAKEGLNAFMTNSWAEAQEVNDLQNILHNKPLIADLEDFLKASPYVVEVQPTPYVVAVQPNSKEEEPIDWIKEVLAEIKETPSHTQSKKPLKQGPCPWVLQKGALHTRECWNHRYYDPLIGKQLEENTVLLKEVESAEDKKAQASLHHMRRHLEAGYKQKPEVCPWIHPDSPQWNAEWSVTHLWETFEEQEKKWENYYTEKTKYVPPVKPTPLASHYGTEIHSYRMGEGTDYRNVVDGYKRDILSAIQIARETVKKPWQSSKPVAPRYPPLPPSFTRSFAPSFERV